MEETGGQKSVEEWLDLKKKDDTAEVPGQYETNDEGMVYFE